MDRETIVKTAALEGAKAAPPVTVVAANVANGWTMTHTATALTIVYVLLQAAYLLWRWRNERIEKETLWLSAHSLSTQPSPPPPLPRWT